MLTYVFEFFVVWKYDMIFFKLGRMHENKIYILYNFLQHFNENQVF
jgi:hypothetical protein